MTQQKREAVYALRKVGRSYSEIADALSLSRNTVKSLCRRSFESNEAEPPLTPEATRCLQCGAELVMSRNHKSRRFCSEACRRTWWLEHPEARQPKTVTSRACACCGEAFLDYPKSQRKYCSHSCYIRARFGGDPHEQ